MNVNNFVEDHEKKIISIYVLIHREKRDQGRYCVCNESKNTYIECLPQTKLFELRKCCVHLNTEEIWKI